MAQIQQPIFVKRQGFQIFVILFIAQITLNVPLNIASKIVVKLTILIMEPLIMMIRLIKAKMVTIQIIIKVRMKKTKMTAIQKSLFLSQFP
jgi:hypothetical protein